MKKVVFVLMLLALSKVFSQQLNLLPGNGTNQNPKAYCGIGTVAISPSQLPNQNLHVHGASVLTRQVSSPKIIMGGGETNGININEGLIGWDGNPVGAGPTYFYNYGYTAGIALTNATTGTGLLEGGVLRMSENELVLENLEEQGTLKLFSPKNLTLSNASSNLFFSPNGIFVNSTFFGSTNLELASFNIGATDQNGLLIKTSTPGKYGLALKMANNNDLALQVFNSNGTLKNFFVKSSGEVMARQFSIQNPSNETKNFSVNNSGEVYARKYTTTLQNIPDYVFESSYKLMPINELKNYIKTNRHLPNIPSAKEIEAKDGEVDLGEMNRLLLEKLEETTLYIFQLEERIKVLEQK